MTSPSQSKPPKPLKAPDNALGFAAHDHGACKAQALETAEAHCASHGLRFTPVRRHALELLLQDHRAMGAYEVLDGLREAGFGSQPPVAYRALEFLVDHGFAHKIERLNAFIACAHPGTRHAPAFLICRGCDAVAEAQSAPVRAALGEAAGALGFRIERTVLEAVGLCPDCAKGAPA
jgi:Fur family zinc uptake transcriptional regulator